MGERVLSLAVIAAVPYAIAVSKFRRPFLSDRYFFIGGGAYVTTPFVVMYAPL